MWCSKPAAETAESTFALLVKWGTWFAAADLLDVRECRPDEVTNAGLPRGPDRGSPLAHLIGSRLPEIGYQEDTVGAGESGGKRFGAIQIGRHHLLGETLVLAGMAGQRADSKLAGTLQCVNDRTALMPRRAEDCNQLSGVGRHVRPTEVS